MSCEPAAHFLSDCLQSKLPLTRPRLHPGQIKFDREILGKLTDTFKRLVGNLMAEDKAERFSIDAAQDDDWMWRRPEA